MRNRLNINLQSRDFLHEVKMTINEINYMTYEWHWKIIWLNKEVLFEGALVTIGLSALVIIAGTVLGCVLAVLRRVDHPIIKYPTILILEIFRNLPVLVLLVWLYYVLPIFGIVMSGFWAAFLGLTLNLSASIAETVRSAIESINRGQLESAIALGYSRFQALKRVILPQAMRRMLPNLLNSYIFMIKHTAIASVIAVNELLHVANVLIGSTFRPLELYSAIALMYLIIIAPLSLGAYWVEKKIGVRTRNV